MTRIQTLVEIISLEEKKRKKRNKIFFIFVFSYQTGKKVIEAHNGKKSAKSGKYTENSWNSYSTTHNNICLQRKKVNIHIITKRMLYNTGNERTTTTTTKLNGKMLLKAKIIESHTYTRIHTKMVVIIIIIVYKSN